MLQRVERYIITHNKYYGYFIVFMIFMSSYFKTINDNKLT